MANENFEIVSESRVAKDLKFWNIIGHEALSHPSVYEVTVLSSIADIDHNDVLGKSFDVIIHFMDKDVSEHQRHCQGYAVRFTRLGQVGRYYEYSITLRSWFWLLTKRTNARIYQERKVSEIFADVCADSPIKSFAKVNEEKLDEHESLRYCVQYMESDFDFLSRLMEDEGVYYWFDSHHDSGMMNLGDNSTSIHEDLPAGETLKWAKAGARGADARFNEVIHWANSKQLHSGKFASRDSDFKAIKKKLEVTINAAEDHDLGDLEVFEFPGDHFTSEKADSRARKRGDELAAKRERHWAVTRWPDVAAGHSFKLQGSPGGVHDRKYLSYTCTFFASHPGYEGITADMDEGISLRRMDRFLSSEKVNLETVKFIETLTSKKAALLPGAQGTSTFVLGVAPLEIPFRPPRVTIRKMMPGPQTAIVVGAAGKEIDVDQFGRVKVQFHWDRYGKSDEKSTAWVRVSQPMAGKGWGGYFMPRIGQEVIIDFLNGDPNRPIIVGRVYNDEQKIPYDSPTQSGFKTRSSPGGNSTNYNEFKFEDKKGAEVVSIHAERNMSTSVEVDDSTSVGHDQSLTVENDRTAMVVGFETITVKKNQTTTVNINQENNIKFTQVNTIGLLQINTIGAGGQVTNVTGPQVNTLIGGQTTNITGAQSTKVTGNQFIGAGGGQDIIVTGDINTSATGEMKIHAATRKDLADGKFDIMANAVKVVASTNLDLMAVGNINAISSGSNTTVLGSNSSGYIGINSEANMGMTRSTFMGLSMSNSLGMDISNVAGLQIENAVALKLVGVGAAEITCATIATEVAAIHNFLPGGGAGAAAAAGWAGAIGGIIALGFGIYDVSKTFEQYADAEEALNKAAKEAVKNDLPGLAGRLSSLARVASARRTEGIAIAAIAASPALAVVAPGFAGLAVVGAGVVVAVTGSTASSETGRLNPDGQPDVNNASVVKGNDDTPPPR